MCIIVAKPRGKAIKKEIYENCFANNPDGAGFIVRERSGELLMKKGFFKFQDFWEAFQEHQSKQAIIHFRIKTHGDLSEENCHPFWVKENELAFAHNGVISISSENNLKMSDTWHFNTKVLQHLHEKLGPNFIADPVIQELITSYISWSKLAFLNTEGNMLIFNKSKGDEEDGVWYSNSSYKWSFNKQNKRRKKYNPPVNLTHNNGATYNTTASGSNYKPNGWSLPPVPGLPPPPDKSTVKINDYIELIHPFRDLKEGMIGKVMAFCQGGEIEAKMYTNTLTGHQIRRLPITVWKKYLSVIDPRTGIEFEDETAMNEGRYFLS